MLQKIIKEFAIPLYVVFTIIISLILTGFKANSNLITTIQLIAIVIGSLELIKDTLESLIKRRFALDYIAIVAITTGVLTGQYLVALVIVLMLAGGNSLERFAMNKAKESLSKLAERIPNKVNILLDGQISEIKIENAKVNDVILVKKGEVIPLDGVLQSETALIDESSLSGESLPQDKLTGNLLRSGTVNLGNAFELKVTKEEKDSTYKKIVEMVKEAQENKSPLVRLADKYSVIFTIITFVICAFAFIFSGGDINRVLAVLVIATPCPLILATPIALIGGINSAARDQIIIKNGAAVEVLSRINTLIFDKTGTITIGKPELVNLEVIKKTYSQAELLGIATAIESNSLHPFAKAIVNKAKEMKITPLVAQDINEILGVGIEAVVNGKKYSIKKSTEEGDIQMYSEDMLLTIFHFKDMPKIGSEKVFVKLQKMKIKMIMFTGDKLEKAQEVLKDLNLNIDVKAECKPEDKKNGIASLKATGATIAMVGDGVNDAPALAMADVGMVFSNEEHTASSEAADIVFLNGDIEAVTKSITISKKTIDIAMQSIYFGIGLSIIGMIFASFGFIVPVVGAFIQEAIDFSVIMNALRSSRIKA